MSEAAITIVVLLALALGFLIGVLAEGCRIGDQVQEHKQEAIDHGYAQYNATTGDWEWKE